MHSEWFNDWFNSGFYQKVYSNRDLTEAAELFYTLNQNQDLTGKKVLDLACGAGRHSLLYAREGCNVTGVDISKVLLNDAREKFQAEFLQGTFVEADLRCFSPQPAAFDIVLNLFTSFGYFVEDKDNFYIFRIAETALNRGGLFYFDYFNIEYLKTHLITEDIKQFDDLAVTQVRKIVGDRVEKQIRLEINGGTKVYFESVKLYSSERIIDEIQRLNLKVSSVFGNYSGEPFNPVESPRCIVVAQKT